MNKILCALLCLILVVLSACAHRETKKETTTELGGGVEMKLVHPKDILAPIQLIQHLSFEHDGKIRSSEAVLTVTPDKLSVIALMPFGGEAFRVEYQNGEIHSKVMPGIGDPVYLKYALADIIVIYTDLKILQNALGKSGQVIDSGLERTITHKAKPIIRISYSVKTRTSAVINYEHLLRNYKIRITPTIPQQEAEE